MREKSFFNLTACVRHMRYFHIPIFSINWIPAKKINRVFLFSFFFFSRRSGGARISGESLQRTSHKIMHSDKFDLIFHEWDAKAYTRQFMTVDTCWKLCLYILWFFLIFPSTRTLFDLYFVQLAILQASQNSSISHGIISKGLFSMKLNIILVWNQI